MAQDVSTDKTGEKQISLELRMKGEPTMGGPSLFFWALYLTSYLSGQGYKLQEPKVLSEFRLELTFSKTDVLEYPRACPPYPAKLKAELSDTPPMCKCTFTGTSGAKETKENIERTVRNAYERGVNQGNKHDTPN